MKEIRRVGAAPKEKKSRNGDVVPRGVTRITKEISTKTEQGFKRPVRQPITSSVTNTNTPKTKPSLREQQKPPLRAPRPSSRTECNTRVIRTANTTVLKKSDDNAKKWYDFAKPNTTVKPIEYTKAKQHSNSASLNNNHEVQRNGKTVTKSTRSSIFVTVRRGQTSKGEQGLGQNQTPEDLSRASSVSSLNADQKNKGAFAKLRKGVSKERIDKIGDKKHDKKGVTKNNNKIVSEEDSYTKEALMQELEEMGEERKKLVLQLGEKNGQLNTLKNEITKLKMFQETSSLQLEKLNEENTALRNRLRDVAYSPLSDNEKQELLQRHHNSAPASIATNLLDDSSGGDMTACPTPDWDKQSSGNVSEVSVACLQDKINQMQETHYSTNEELQATLQELTDLQRQLTELQQDNERLVEEKNLMFDSLCRQTERLNDTRTEVESLKQLLYRDKDDSNQFENAVEREQKLVGLLQSAQDERESLLLKQEQLSNELQDVRALSIEQATEIEQLSERVKTLESTLDAKHAEHKLLDQELAIAKDQSSSRQIEIDRLTDLLENARTKINELEQDRTLSDKSELDELLDNARKEKDALESEVSHLKEQVARSRNETEKLREQVSVLQEECKVTRNNAKCTQSELEYKCEKLLAEKNNIAEQLQQLQEAANELQVQTQCQLEDKRQLSSVLSETQRNLSETERRNLELENEVADLKKLREEENEEWEKFQNDLLTSVRVANDFKTEAQQNVQKLILENKAERERVRLLEAQIDKLKGASEASLNPKEKKKSHTRVTSDRISVHRRQISASSISLQGEKSTLAIMERLKTFGTKILGTSKTDERRLSKQEKEQMEYINKLYYKIGPKLPEDQLSETDKAIVRLKKIFDQEVMHVKAKPVANKSKSSLDISAPFVTSVMCNTKLEEISRNPKIKPANIVRNEAFFATHDLSEAKRSKSLDDLHFLEDKRLSRNSFQRANTLENLCTDEHIVLRPANSRLKLNLTKGTYRFTKKDEDKLEARDTIVQSVGHTQSDFEATDSFLFEKPVQHPPKKVSYENLEEMYRKIDMSLPEEQLSKQEQFVVRLKRGLDEMGRKNTLRKHPGFVRKKVDISRPTQESVLRNLPLVNILNDPGIHSVETKPEEPKKSFNLMKWGKGRKKSDDICDAVNESVITKEEVIQEDVEEDMDAKKDTGSVSSLFESVILHSPLYKVITERNGPSFDHKRKSEETVAEKPFEPSSSDEVTGKSAEVVVVKSPELVATVEASSEVRDVYKAIIVPVVDVTPAEESVPLDEPFLESLKKHNLDSGEISLVLSYTQSPGYKPPYSPITKEEMRFIERAKLEYPSSPRLDDDLPESDGVYEEPEYENFMFLRRNENRDEERPLSLEIKKPVPLPRKFIENTDSSCGRDDGNVEETDDGLERDVTNSNGSLEFAEAAQPQSSESCVPDLQNEDFAAQSNTKSTQNECLKEPEELITETDEDGSVQENVEHVTVTDVPELSDSHIKIDSEVYETISPQENGLRLGNNENPSDVAKSSMKRRNSKAELHGKQPIGDLHSTSDENTLRILENFLENERTASSQNATCKIRDANDSSNESLKLRKVPKFFTRDSAPSSREKDREPMAQILKEDPPDAIDATLQQSLPNTDSVDQSYLSLFKSPEEKLYEEISGTAPRHPTTGFINIHFLTVSSDDSDIVDEDNALKLTDEEKQQEEKPIDYVSMDPPEKKRLLKRAESNPSASSTKKPKKINHDKYLDKCELERTSPETSGSSRESLYVGRYSLGSRSSFEAARKKFEANVGTPAPPGMQFSGSNLKEPAKRRKIPSEKTTSEKLDKEKTK